MEELDQFDRKILALLQTDARLTNNEIGEKIGLSPSQCSRRRQRLEDQGIISGYHARLSREKAGLGLTSIIAVTLATHNADNAKRLADLFARLPNVQEAYQMTGEMDYYVKVVTPDLKALSALISEELLPHEAVQHVKTAIVRDSPKETTAIPLGYPS